jgi:hypothetical protein
MSPWFLSITMFACQGSVPVVQQSPTALLRQPEFVPAVAATQVSCDTSVVCATDGPPSSVATENSVETENAVDEADCLEALANSNQARKAALFHGERCDAAERAVQFAATAMAECNTPVAQFEAASNAAIVLCSYGCESVWVGLWRRLAETTHTYLQEQSSSFSTDRQNFVANEIAWVRASCERTAE